MNDLDRRKSQRRASVLTLGFGSVFTLNGAFNVLRWEGVGRVVHAAMLIVGVALLVIGCALLARSKKPPVTL